MKQYLSRYTPKANWKRIYRRVRIEAKDGCPLAQRALINDFSPVPEYQWLSFSRFAKWEMRGAW